MKRKLILSCGAILCFLAVSVFAADQAKAPAAGQRTALFDGKNLDAWDVLKCEAVIENGNVFIKAGNGVVQTKKKYGNFVLEYEWKALPTDFWDSGVYFRYDSIPAGHPWPPRYQANCRKGDEGNITELKGASSHGLFKNGEWNSFKLTVRGTTAKMEMNGKPAWKTKGLEGPKQGYISLQAEVPGGGQCLFRNIYITELK
jgi:Domain of Unknown Function (DUF1080)